MAITRRRQRWWTLVAIAIVLLAGIGALAFRLSPWPSALVLRFVLESSAAASNRRVAGFVPDGISTQRNLQYDPGDKGALLDLHRPAAMAGKKLPLVVWIHGGGFIAGSRDEVANYARIVAADGYAVAAVDYPLAPGANYPAPVRQLARALAFLTAHADELNIDAQRVVLAGDSAGAQLAAQLAAPASSPDYARSTGLQAGIPRAAIRGVVLYCGPLDGGMMARQISESWFLHTIVWSYFGSRRPQQTLLDGFSVVPQLTAEFPPTFISAGNTDPLAPQSVAFAEALAAKGVRVDALFFPPERKPGLAHEYQFDLNLDASQEALARTRAFLRESLAP